MIRSAFLSSLIGNKWDWRNHNCWTFATHVERELFGRDLPSIAVPRDMSKRWVLQSFEGHPQRAEWQEVAAGPGDLILAADGALCLMAHLRLPGHIGVWLKPEGMIIHCDEHQGVSFETPVALVSRGWKHLRFFEPAQ